MPDPCVLALGLVSGCAGWLFNMIATGAPSWRTVQGVPGAAEGTVIHQGIWDMCVEVPGSDLVCPHQEPDYFAEGVVKAARGLMVTSVVVTGGALVSAFLGVRCWRPSPDLLLAGLSGVAVFCGGIFSIIPVAWFTSELKSIKASGTDLRVGYCVVMGFIASAFQFIGGACLMTCWYDFSKKRKRAAQARAHPRDPPRSETCAPDRTCRVTAAVALGDIEPRSSSSRLRESVCTEQRD
ncbi:claudin-23-like [Scleropages formosus]|uniref:claudin-23-like n=1 Tax=Scleropages formosus TaxID=113540 RepID=UPI000878A8D6|nr:claudin-23-like [Scleropages formosus]